MLTGAPALPSGERTRCIYDVLETSDAEQWATELYNTEDGFHRLLKPTGADITPATNKKATLRQRVQSNASGCAAWRICKQLMKQKPQTDG